MTSKADEDLLKILNTDSIKIEARLQGWNYILSLTGSEAGIKRLTSYEKYGPFLLSYVKKPQPEKESLNLAYKCLINMANSKQGTAFLLAADKHWLPSLLREVCNASDDFVVDRCYILANLSVCCNILEHEEVVSFFPDLCLHLKDKFCSTEKETRDKYMFLSLVLSNVSQTPKGRKLLMEDEYFLSVLFMGLNPDEPETRRLGMALTIRNFCSETSYHTRLLEYLNVLPVLLLPLMGPEEYEEETIEQLPVECQYLEHTKEREKFPQIRKALIQALSLLCYTKGGWKRLKSSGVYAVARELHSSEGDPDVKEAIETLVGFLLVEEYALPADDLALVPAETDLLQDIPNVVL